MILATYCRILSSLGSKFFGRFFNFSSLTIRRIITQLEAMKRKAGRPSKENGDQIGNNFDGKKSVEIMAENSKDSRNQIQRYIRLTNLIDPLLEMVDSNDLAMNSAVELSFLSAKQQAEVLDVMDMELSSPSIEQAKKIRKIGEDGSLDFDSVLSISPTSIRG